MAFSPIISWQICGETMETVTDFILLGVKITAAMILKDTCSWKKIYDKTRQCIKKQRLHFSDKGPYSQNYVLFCFPVFMHGCKN